MRRILWTSLLVLVVGVSPSIAAAQCSGGMMGGGHQHGHKSESKGDRKARQNIDKILGEDRGRALLLEAILADPDFMRDVIAGIGADPDWRSYAAAKLDLGNGGSGAARQGAATKGKRGEEERPVVQYTCPMHPDVISDRPGKCPKCGMTLERVSPDEGE